MENDQELGSEQVAEKEKTVKNKLESLARLYGFYGFKVTRVAYDPEENVGEADMVVLEGGKKVIFRFCYNFSAGADAEHTGYKGELTKL